MSHYAVLVLVEPNAQSNNLENLVAGRLAPFDENLLVEEYDRKCLCIGHLARRKAGEILAGEMGGWKDARNAFWKKYPVTINPKDREAFREEDERLNRIWREEFAVPRQRREEEIFLSLPGHTDPNPECEGCMGKGVYRSQYNPLSKWDWWQIGGRWTGSLDGHSPESDPENIETCPICHGTGKHDDELGLEERAKDPTYTCNGCGGKGKRLKWPTAWKTYIGDALPVHAIKPDFVPFAILTPDGEWHEEGQMGLFAVVSDEKDDWDDEAHKILQAHPDCIAVLTDCHI